MGLPGPAFYDDDEVFATYQSRRDRPENPNDTIEQPALFELLGDLRGKRILDLGCGGAAFGRAAMARGCLGYTGVDGSANMVEVAQRNLAGTPGRVVHADLVSWQIPVCSFDLVVSSLVLHYLPLLEPVFEGVFYALEPGGRFVFSVEHPVITSCDRAYASSGPRQNWIVDGYFDTGPRDTSWMGGAVRKHHRTVEDYFVGLQVAGFAVEGMREGRPARSHFASEATYLRRMRIPLFLLMAGRKV